MYIRGCCPFAPAIISEPLRENSTVGSVRDQIPIIIIKFCTPGTVSLRFNKDAIGIFYFLTTLEFQRRLKAWCLGLSRILGLCLKRGCRGEFPQCFKHFCGFQGLFKRVRGWRAVDDSGLKAMQLHFECVFVPLNGLDSNAKTWAVPMRSLEVEPD